MGSTIAAGENVITPGLNTVYKFDLSSVPEECLSTALVAIIVRGKGTIRMDIEREEGALIFDGVDDYGICTGLPILDDYTVICKREIINKETGSVASKRTSSSQWDGAFIFERNNQLTSFGQNNYRTIQQNNVSYMTTTSYNGGTINRGSLQDTEYLILGADGFNITLNRAHGFSNCAIYYFALYNKSLTSEEIETEKERLNEEWLKRSKVTIPEPDVYYDLSLKDNSSPTRNIIDDLSGNGHDAEIFNEYFPSVMLLSETDEDTTVEYPFPLLDEEDITNSPEWSDPEQEII